MLNRTPPNRLLLQCNSMTWDVNYLFDVDVSNSAETKATICGNANVVLLWFHQNSSIICVCSNYVVTLLLFNIEHQLKLLSWL